MALPLQSNRDTAKSVLRLIRVVIGGERLVPTLSRYTERWNLLLSELKRQSLKENCNEITTQRAVMRCDASQKKKNKTSLCS